MSSLRQEGESDTGGDEESRKQGSRLHAGVAESSLMFILLFGSDAFDDDSSFTRYIDLRRTGVVSCSFCTTPIVQKVARPPIAVAFVTSSIPNDHPHRAATR